MSVGYNALLDSLTPAELSRIEGKSKISLENRDLEFRRKQNERRTGCEISRSFEKD